MAPHTRGRRAGDKRAFTAEQEAHIRQTICDKRPEPLKMEFVLWSRAAVSARSASIWRAGASCRGNPSAPTSCRPSRSVPSTMQFLDGSTRSYPIKRTARTAHHADPAGDVHGGTPVDLRSRDRRADAQGVSRCWTSSSDHQPEACGRLAAALTIMSAVGLAGSTAVPTYADAAGGWRASYLSDTRKR